MVNLNVLSVSMGSMVIRHRHRTVIGSAHGGFGDKNLAQFPTNVRVIGSSIFGDGAISRCFVFATISQW
jgi:hypothetical protein